VFVRFVTPLYLTKRLIKFSFNEEKGRKRVSTLELAIVAKMTGGKIVEYRGELALTFLNLLGG